MAREYDDHLFNPQPTKNISKVTLPLPHMIEYDLKVDKLHKAREHDDHLYNPQPTKNISKVTLPLSRMIEYDLKVVELTHSWPEPPSFIHLIL